MKQIEFYGDTLDIIELESGQAGIVARRLVENLGLDWGNQTRKLENPIYECCVIATAAADGRTHNMIVLPLKRLNFYLCNISVNRIRKDLQERVLKYQMECADVLYNYWAKGYAINHRPTTEGILTDYVSGIGSVSTHFLNNLLKSSETPEHHNVMQQVIMSILVEALDAEDVDIQNNLVKRKSWMHMNTVELTVIQTVESEIGLYFAKSGLPKSPEKVVDMAQAVGKNTTRRLRRAMFASEVFSDKFEDCIVGLIGVK